MRQKKKYLSCSCTSYFLIELIFLIPYCMLRALAGMWLRHTLGSPVEDWNLRRCWVGVVLAIASYWSNVQCIRLRLDIIVVIMITNWSGWKFSRFKYFVSPSEFNPLHYHNHYIFEIFFNLGRIALTAQFLCLSRIFLIFFVSSTLQNFLFYWTLTLRCNTNFEKIVSSILL